MGKKNEKKEARNDILDIILLFIAGLAPFVDTLFGGIISLIMLVAYAITTGEKKKMEKALLIICFIGIVIYFLGYFSIENMDGHGLDNIGEAIAYAMILNIGRLILFVSSLVLLIIKHSKKIVIPIILVIVALIISTYFKDNYVQSYKIGKLHTVNEFKQELLDRGLYDESTDYRLYGVDGNNDRGILLSFDNNKDDKYPLYAYSEIGNEWVIYYIDGNIYATEGEYWDNRVAFGHDNDGYDEEKMIINPLPVFYSETDTMTTYNPKKNKYEKGKTISAGEFRYYSKDHSKENSVFIDIPKVASYGKNIYVVDRIDYKSLY